MAVRKKITTTFETWREMNVSEKAAMNAFLQTFHADHGRAPKEHELWRASVVGRFHDRVANDAFRELQKAGGRRENGLHAFLINAHVMGFSVWITTGWKGDWSPPAFHGATPPAQEPQP